MTVSPPVPVPVSPFQTYAAAIFSAVVLIAGGLNSLLVTFGGAAPLHTKIAAAIVFGILTLGAVIAYGVKLLPARRWQGIVKTGVAIIAALASIAVPYFVNGTFNVATDLPLVAVAVVNALATEFGVQIRTA